MNQELWAVNHTFQEEIVLVAKQRRILWPVLRKYNAVDFVAKTPIPTFL